MGTSNVLPDDLKTRNICKYELEGCRKLSQRFKVSVSPIRNIVLKMEDHWNSPFEGNVVGREKYLKRKGKEWLEWPQTKPRQPPKSFKNILLLVVSLYIIPQSSALFTRNRRIQAELSEISKGSFRQTRTILMVLF